MTYFLEEDLALVRKYFPKATLTTLRTPFDLTERPSTTTTGCHETAAPQQPWYGSLFSELAN